MRKKQWIQRMLAAVLVFACLFSQAPPALARGELFLYEYRQSIKDELNSFLGEGMSCAVFAGGYLWLGGSKGLYQYDGSSFRCIPYGEQPLTSPAVSALYADSQGRLWIGTQDAGAVCYQDGAFSYYSGISGPVSCFAENPEDGSLLVGAQGGSYQISPQGIVKQASFLPKSASVVSFAWGAEGDYLGVTQDGTLLIGIGVLPEDAGKELSQLTAHTFTQVHLASDGVYRIATDGSEMVLITLFDNGYDFDVVSTAPVEQASAVYEDSEGRIWICGETGAGYFDYYEVFQRVDNLLLNGNMQAMAQDSGGGYWFVSPVQGVLRLTHSPVWDLSMAGGLSHTQVSTVSAYGGLLWVGAQDGLYLLDADGRPVENDLTELLEGVEVHCLFPDSQGYLWIGTYGEYGVIRCDQNEDRLYFPAGESGIGGAKVYELSEDRAGNILVATDQGISIIRDSLWLDNMTPDQDGLPAAPVLTLSGEEEKIYAGTAGQGAFVVDKDGVTSLFTPGEDALPLVGRLVSDEQNGGRWACAGDTLCFWDEEGLRPVRQFPGEELCDAILTEQGELWLFFRSKIMAFDAAGLLSSGERTPANRAILPGDGLFTLVSRRSHGCAVEGGVCFAGQNGLGYIPFTQRRKESAWPKARVSSALLDGQLVMEPSSLTLEPGIRSLTLNLSCPDFSSRGPITFICRLEGQDTQARILDPSSPASVTYTNLPPGDYTFSLQAFTENGDFASEEATLSITRPWSLREALEGHLLWVVAAALLLFAGIAAALLCYQWGKKSGLKKK
ncbi:MAG: hypothetical protein HFJ86_04970 [Oscillospiraceae bacterium]|jgi:hypothetical protein|nr:hypothetical protein [Oscillospiraceae bacterium]